MSCAQVMYQPYAGSPYTAPPSTPHTSSTPTNNSELQHNQHQQATTAQQQQQTNSQQTVNQERGNTNVTSPTAPSSTNTTSSTTPTQQSGQQQVSATAPETPRGPSRTASYRAASNGSAAGDTEAPPEKKLCSERQTPVTPIPPTHNPYHAAFHHHHHHHLLNQHHLHHHHNNNLNQHNNNNNADQTPHPNDIRYISANCVVVTHYRGDTASVVDEHFTRALTPCDKPQKASSPMHSRNFPPSFWNSNYTRTAMGTLGHLGAHGTAGDLYDPYHASLHSLQNTGHHDPWTTYSLSSQAYSHRSMAHDMYQAAMSTSSPRPYHQYGNLLQPSLARIPALPTVQAQMSMTKPESWGRYHEAFTGDLAAAHGLEGGYSATHYPTVPAGLESAVQQEGHKDLYWF